jgi:hypothetical protein
MKSTLEFNLPEDNLDFEFCSKGPELVSSLWELINNDLPRFIRHGQPNDVLTSDEADKFRKYLINYLTDDGFMVLIDKNF